MECPYCLKKTSDVARKCVHCGKDLKSPESRLASTPVICPVCRVNTEILNLAGIELDYCYACNGIWFDKGELRAFVELLSDQKIVSDMKMVLTDMSVIYQTQNRSAYVDCPVCMQPMIHKKFLDVSDIILDRCHDHGVWTEHGDLMGILDMVAAGVLDDVIAKAKRQKQRHLDQRLKSIEARQSRMSMELSGIKTRTRYDFILDLLGFA